jgi:hypothetical protein
MVDMPISDPPTTWRPRAPTTAVALKQARLLLSLVLISSGCWIAVNEASEKDKCQTTLGRMAVRLKLDSYYSSCRCVKLGVLDFSDPCNLPLAAALGLV